MSNFVENAQNCHLLIHDILLKEWDPIGVRHIPEAQDEYNAYVAEVYRLLTKRASRQEIFDYLWWVETKHMSLCGDRQRTEMIAEKLAELAAKIDTIPPATPTAHARR